MVKLKDSMQFQVDFSENGITNFNADDILLVQYRVTTVFPVQVTAQVKWNQFDRFLVNYTPKDGIDANVTLTISGFNDAVNNAGVQSTTTFAVDTKDLQDS